MKGRLPPWFKKKLPDAGIYSEMKELMGGLRLHTICESAICPNRGDCFSKRTATFLILGNICTRNCTFCAVEKGVPCPVDPDEPVRIADAVVRLNLRHAVVTSVTRDDLPDGGAEHFAKTTAAIKSRNAALTVEILIPDFLGRLDALEKALSASPAVLNHNIETIERLYPTVRPHADFQRSLNIFRCVKRIDLNIITKSGIMVGLGETKEELLHAMEALREAGCDLLTIGQYLQPSPAHHPVVRYVLPEEFEEYARSAVSMGFRGVASAPLVRSSFDAKELFESAASGSLPTAENEVKPF